MSEELESAAKSLEAGGATGASTDKLLETGHPEKPQSQKYSEGNTDAHYPEDLDGEGSKLYGPSNQGPGYEVDNSLEIDYDKLEEEVAETAEKYDIPNYFDGVEVADLDGAVAAAGHRPSAYLADPVESLTDLLEHDSFTMDKSGQLYGVDVLEWDTYFLADRENYFSKSPEEKEMVNFHEHQHAIQYNSDWGSELDHLLNLEPEQIEYLDSIDKHTSDFITEGATQMVTESIIPEGEKLGRGYYEAEKNLVEMNMWNRGLTSNPKIGSKETNKDISVDILNIPVISASGSTDILRGWVSKKDYW